MNTSLHGEEQANKGVVLAQLEAYTVYTSN